MPGSWNDGSPLGRAAARVTALDAELTKAAARVTRRKAALAEILDSIASLPLDVAISETGSLIVKQMAAARLVEVAEDGAEAVARDLERVQGVSTDLERRLQRFEGELAALDDETVPMNLSPAQRKARAALARWQLAVIAGDPGDVGDLRAAYDGGEPVVMAGNVFDLDAFEREINQLVDKAG